MESMLGDFDDREEFLDEIDAPDFLERSQSSEYQQAIADLAELFQSRAVAIEKLPGGFYIAIAFEKFSDSEGIEVLQTEFLARSCFLFSSDYNLTKTYPGYLIIFPTTDKFEAIAAMGSQGCMYESCIGGFLQWLRELDLEQPFVVTSIGFNHIDLRFLTSIKDPEKLATRMADFAPEMMLQGSINSIEELADDLRTSDRQGLWWD